VTDAPARRFVCRACGRAYDRWSARCPHPSCLDLKEGLVDARSLEVPRPVASPATPTPAPAPLTQIQAIDPTPEPAETPAFLPTPESPRLRLVPSLPEPDPPDPDEEPADVATSASDPIPLSEVAEATFVRDSTGLAPLDHVLGGGLVEASVVLLAAPPGVGKSSLTLQMLNGLGHRCLYVTGEETREQIAATARRIGAASNKIYVLVETNITRIFEHARAIRAQTIAIDSIQKMRCEDLDSRAGTPAQLKECTVRFAQYAKTTRTALWLIGHITGDGSIAGPKQVEHDVDVVLELEQGAAFEGNERILRCAGKNRFFATNVTGRFELTANGFVPVDGDGWDEVEL
jgi:predicted ATP-dependent serine protease